jgi:outer membrane protein assembly factor BamB
MHTTERVEASPVVADGIMYGSEPGGSVTALDTLTGHPIWKYTRAMPKGVRGCCGLVNRDGAILNGLVYVGTFDSHLALDTNPSCRTATVG